MLQKEKNKFSTLKYLHLRDKNKIDLLNLSKTEVDRLSNILNYSVNKFFNINLSKKQFRVIYDPAISIINEFYIANENIDLKDLILSDKKIRIPTDLYNLRLMQHGKSFSLLKSIINLKNNYEIKSRVNLNEIEIENKKINNTFKNKLKINILKIINTLSFFKKKKIYIDIFNFSLYLKILSNGFSPQFFSLVNPKYKKREFIYEIRSKLYEIGEKFNKSEDEKKSWYVLIFQLPISLIESFESLYKFNVNIKNKINKFVLSNIRKNEIETIFISKNLENKKTKVEIFQYGSGLFFDKKHLFSTQFEYEIADRVYSWSNPNNNKVKQIPLFKTYNKNQSDFYSLKHILLINTSSSFFINFVTDLCLKELLKVFQIKLNF